MITLLASITGFISSIFPEILKFLKDKNDKRHELFIMEKQIEFSRTSNLQQIAEIEIARDLHDNFNLYSTYKTGINWIDALNGTVRPVLAYSFFGLYGMVKYTQYKALTTVNLTVEYLDILWNIDDQAIFAGIISFYFGQRTFSKLWRR